MDVQWTAQCSVGKCSVYNTTLHNITLYYYYLIGKNENFENSTPEQKDIVVRTLKDMDIYIENSETDNRISEEKRLDYMLQYWAIKEMIFSSYKVYLKYLSRELFFEKYFKTCSYKTKEDTKEFLDYFIKTLKKELQRISESKVI